MKAYKVSSPEEWHAIRARVTTATEVCAILGLDPWTSVAKMLDEKANSTFTGNAYTWVGQALELVVVKATNELMSRDFKLFEDTGGKVIYADFDVGLGATPDATDGTDLLECKTTGTRNWYKWADWPPIKYLCQLQVQLICTDSAVGYLSVMSTDLQQYGPVLDIKLSVFQVSRSLQFEQGLKRELQKHNKCLAEGKVLRVDRKHSSLMAFELLKSYKKVL